MQLTIDIGMSSLDFALPLYNDNVRELFVLLSSFSGVFRGGMLSPEQF